MKCGVPFAFRRFVRMSQPVSVTSSVCSNCADHKPSDVTAVQLSGHDTSRQAPSDIMGSMVKVCPAFITPTAEFSGKVKQKYLKNEQFKNIGVPFATHWHNVAH
jgi:hypothetical protein